MRFVIILLSRFLFEIGMTSPAVIRRLIRLSGLGKNDHVVEIGAGKGHITDRLTAVCGRVTAIEIDPRLYQKLAEKYRLRSNLRLLCGDFLKGSLPKTPYKVFANIPFNRTTAIIKKLTESGNPPEDAWLVTEKGAAKRFMGQPQETAVSLLLKPFFDGEIRYYFRREDFHPSPAVDAVLFHLRKKAAPDIPVRERGAYRRFIASCFSGQGGLSARLTKRQIATALKREGLSPGARSEEMRYVQWLCLFRCWLRYGR